MLEKTLESMRKSPKRLEFAMKVVEAMIGCLHSFPGFVSELFDLTSLLAEVHPGFLLKVF